MWRFARNSLALKMNIQRRGMKLDTRCPMCYRFDEDGGYCFLKCKLVKRGWASLSLESVRLNLLLKKSAWDVAMEVISLKEEDCLQSMLFLWKWWNVRNKVDRGELVQSGEGAAGDVLRMFGYLSRKERKPVQRGTETAQWTTPPQGLLKINLDGSFVPDTLQGSWGFVIRDHKGSAVLAGAGNLGSVPDAITVEAAACAKALQ
jgi:hypothetical protein